MKITRLRGLLGAAFLLLCGFLAWADNEPRGAAVAAVAAPAVAGPPSADIPVPVGAPAAAGPAAAGVPDLPMERFAEWTVRYLAAPAEQRAALLAEGHALAAVRRAAMAKLIRTDPRRALAEAVPMVARQHLPAEIVAQLEERVSGRGELAFNAVTPLPNQPAPAEPTFRTALIDGQEYRAHVFGRRDVPATVQSTSLNGVALDGHLAVAESPLRILEKGEVAANRPLDTVCGISGNATAVSTDTPLNTAAGGATAVEYNGVVHILCGSNHLAQIQARLESTEESQVANAAAGGPGSSDVQGRPNYAWTHGPKKLLVIRVDFSDKPGTPVNASGAAMTETYVSDITGVVKGFYADNSYNQTSLELAPAVNDDSPDITPVLRLPQTSAYYAPGTFDRSAQLHQDAENAAAVAGFDLNSYDRVGVAFGYLSGYWWAGLGNVTGRNFWINGYWDFRVVAHELGHTYGLMHSNFWHSSDSSNPTSTTGTSEEYGDAMDVMGNGNSTAHHFDHWNKSILQWIPDAAVTTVTTSGTYRIYQLDERTTDLSLPHALKFKSDDTRDYWIGYRGNLPVGNVANSAYVIWGYHYNQQGNLLNVSRATSNSSYDAPLPVGQSYTDNNAAITFRSVAAGRSGRETWIDVAVNFLPNVHWSQSTDYVVGEQEGAAVLRLVRTGDASAAVSVNYATSDIPAPNTSAQAGVDYVAQSGAVTWAAGDASDKFISISIISDDISEGGERFNVTLSSPSGAVLSGNPVAVVNPTDRDVRDFSFPPLDVFGWVRKALVLPDGNLLLGGSFRDARDSDGNFHAANGLAKVTNEGRYLPAFSAPVSGGEGVVYDLETQADGKIIVAGSFSAVAGASHGNIARLLPDGTVDGTFNASANGTIFSMVVQADGKILLGGTFTQVSGVPRVQLARLNADGSVDPDFIPPGFDPAQNGSVQTMAIQPDGHILVGGTFSLIVGSRIYTDLCRVLTTGSIDSTFIPDGGPGGRVHALAVLPDGRIMVGGEFQNFGNQPRGHLARITASGALDPIFTVGVDGPCTALLPLADGRLVIGGVFTHINGIADDSIAILMPNDSVDTYFASIGGFQGGEVSDILMLPNGRLQFCGSYQPFQYNQTWSGVWRFMSGVTRPPGTVQFTAATARGDEGGTVTVTASRIGGSGAISVNYATADDSATAADYVSASGTLTWADGDTSPRAITIALSSDSLAEADETFFINLGSPLWGGVNLGAVQRQVVTIHSTNSPPPPPPPPPPPGSWQTADVGAVGRVGSSSESGSTITVNGSGADIWGAADGFTFRAQQLTGDGAIVARVASAGNTNGWAKAGIMFREDLTAGAREVMNFVTPGGHSAIQYRLTPGGTSAQLTDTWWGAPLWLMLVRTGNSFAGYHSGDGNNWQPIGTVTCAMPATIYVGLAVSSHDNTTLNTATFDNVNILATNPPPPPDAPAAPTNLMASGVTGTTASLRWTDNASTETGFSIERAPGNTTNFATAGTAASNATTWTDSGLSPNTAYTYRLRAVRDGVYSDYSNTFTIVTSDGPPPTGWQAVNVGIVGQAGSETIAGDTVTVNAGGQDIWDRADGFRFVYQFLSGDCEIKARVARLDNTHAWAKAGLMFRETLASGARHVSYVLTADNTSGLESRVADSDITNFANGPWVNAPYWIRLVRSGNVFTASLSPDGVNWTVMGTQTLGMATQLYVGLAVSSHNTALATTAVFEHVSVPTNNPPPPPPPPPPAWTQTAWSASGTFTSSGTSLTIDTTGADIWNQFDSGLFVSKAWHGDGEIVTRVDSMTNTHPWAKAGLMFRQTTDAVSPNVLVALTPGVGATFQARTTSSGVTNEVQHSWLPGAPCWLKLTRTGDTFTAAFSIDGTSWTSLGSQTVVMPADILIGIAASSHTSSTAMSAAFSGISVH
ncbi:MAG: hypothetical protein JWQ83_959 [Lacunisphaera sp.]|nr:hypothetical protein [Lacunisphaera sp.]